MVKRKVIDKDIRNTALKFAQILESQGIAVEKLIVFGSYVKNKASGESDIDLCIVSPEFGRDPVEELQFLFKQTRKVDTRIEPIPVSPQEYRESVSPLIFEIKKFGKEIVVK